MGDVEALNSARQRVWRGISRERASAAPGTVKKRKSFLKDAKATRRAPTFVIVTKGLGMACQMLYGEADEVARNGVLGINFGQR